MLSYFGAKPVAHARGVACMQTAASSGTHRLIGAVRVPALFSGGVTEDVRTAGAHAVQVRCGVEGDGGAH